MAGATHRQCRRALSRGMERKRLVLAAILLRILLGNGNKIKVGNLKDDITRLEIGGCLYLEVEQFATGGCEFIIVH